jgi:pyrimidine-nucleoside phosphorylase/thymidine phosphorylase
MLILAGEAADEQEATARLGQVLDSGQVYAKFRAWIEAQGGDVAYVDEPGRLARARTVRMLTAPQSGYVAALNAREVGYAAMLLGGGRARKEDRIDPAVGVVLHAKIGDRVQRGQPLLAIHANDETNLAEARERLLAAYSWSQAPISPPPLIHQIIA